MTTPKSIDADGGTGPEVRVSSTGARLVVRDTGGAGPVILLLHGGPGCPDYLAPVAAILPPGVRAVTFDQRGVGGSTCAGDYRVEDYVADIDAVRPPRRRPAAPAGPLLGWPAGPAVPGQASRSRRQPVPAELRRRRWPAVDPDRAGGSHAQPAPGRPARLRSPGRLGCRNLAPRSGRRPRRTSGVRPSLAQLLPAERNPACRRPVMAARSGPGRRAPHREVHQGAAGVQPGRTGQRPAAGPVALRRRRHLRPQRRARDDPVPHRPAHRPSRMRTPPLASGTPGLPAFDHPVLRCGHPARSARLARAGWRGSEIATLGHHRIRVQYDGRLSAHTSPRAVAECGTRAPRQ